MSVPGERPPAPTGTCWKWGGIGCIGCGCVIAIAMVVASVVLFSRPEGREIWRTAQQTAEAVRRMRQIGDAISKYTHDKGDFPERLADLSPTYIEETQLRPPDEGGEGSFEYRKPPRNAPGDFVMLTYEVKNPLAPDRAPSVRYTLNKAGQIGTTTVPPRPMEPERPPGP